MTVKGLTFGLVGWLAVMGWAWPTWASDPTHRFILHIDSNAPQAHGDMASYFKTIIEAKSAGKIEIRVADAGQGLDDLASGRVDLAIGAIDGMTDKVPELGIFSIPFLVETRDVLARQLASQGPLRQELETIIGQRLPTLTILALGVSGAKNIANSRQPVKLPSDAKGLKIWNMESSLDREIWTTLNTLAVKDEHADFPKAVQEGRADALEITIADYLARQDYAVAPFLSMTRHRIQVTHFSMANTRWNRLPPDLQALFTETAQAAAELGMKKSIEYEEATKTSLNERFGVTVTEVNTHDFMAIVKPIQDRLAKELGGEKLLRLIRGEVDNDAN